MAGNSELHIVRDRGEFNGFGNLFRKEAHQWWGTWQWVIQTVIWLAIVNGMLAMVLLAAPRIEAAQAQGKIDMERETAAKETLAQTGLMVFFVFSGLAPAVGVVILGQDAIIQERQTGTAAWVLSKPVSRTAFLLSKLTADGLGILVTMVVIQGIVGYIIYRAGTGIALEPEAFVAAQGLVVLLLFFYLSLTLMLGTFFRTRGPVIGLPMVLIFGNQLTGLAPWLGKVLPWNLVQDLGPDQPALALALAQGLPLPTISPIIGTVGLSLVFVAVALWRFRCEEF